MDEQEQEPKTKTFLVDRSVTVVRIAYRCTNPKCKAIDYGKYYPTEMIAPIIQCWQCGNGRGLNNFNEMLSASNGPRGMIPFDELTGKLITSMHVTDNMPGTVTRTGPQAVN